MQAFSLRSAPDDAQCVDIFVTTFPPFGGVELLQSEADTRPTLVCGAMRVTLPIPLAKTLFYRPIPPTDSCRLFVVRWV